jgi:hypothetical protein
VEPETRYFVSYDANQKMSIKGQDLGSLVPMRRYPPFNNMFNDLNGNDAVGTGGHTAPRFDLRVPAENFGSPFCRTAAGQNGVHGVFGGTPKTARETRALPKINCAANL